MESLIVPNAVTMPLSSRRDAVNPVRGVGTATKLATASWFQEAVTFVHRQVRQSIGVISVRNMSSPFEVMVANAHESRSRYLSFARYRQR